jgi:dolichol-phosphate mannosyltransferase
MIFVLLPAYNEGKGISALLSTLHEMFRSFPEPCRVIVVNDGSVDDTETKVRSFALHLNLKLISFEKNRGVEEVFTAGFRYACAESVDPANDVCVVLDADGTQDPRVLFDLLGKVRAGDDLVIASRFRKPGKMVGCPPLRYFYSVAVSWIMRIFVRLPNVRDYSMFFRAYRISLLNRGFAEYGDALLAGKGFASAAVCLIKLGNLTKRISEVPLVLRYDLKHGKSGMKIMKTIRGYFELLWDCFRTDRFRRLKSSSTK